MGCGGSKGGDVITQEHLQENDRKSKKLEEMKDTKASSETTNKTANDDKILKEKEEVERKLKEEAEKKAREEQEEKERKEKEEREKKEAAEKEEALRKAEEAEEEAFKKEIEEKMKKEAEEKAEKEKALAAAQQNAPPVHSGYMSKQGQVFRTWKRRFFVLEKGELRYFVEETFEGSGEGQQQMGTPLFLRGYAVSRFEDTKLTISTSGRPSSTNIRGRAVSTVEGAMTGSARSLLLDVATESEREMWEEAINSHIQYCNSLPED